MPKRNIDSSKITLSSFAIDVPIEESESYLNNYGALNETPFIDRTAT